MAQDKWHVLVVEDDADGQVMMSTLLGHMNISSDIAADAAEAEYFLFESGKTYDAAIIDLALPDKDGWQILAEVLDNEQTADLTCIAVTAYHTSKLREDAIMAGFQGVLRQTGRWHHLLARTAKYARITRAIPPASVETAALLEWGEAYLRPDFTVPHFLGGKSTELTLKVQPCCAPTTALRTGRFRKVVVRRVRPRARSDHLAV